MARSGIQAFSEFHFLFAPEKGNKKGSETKERGREERKVSTCLFVGSGNLKGGSLSEQSFGERTESGKFGRSILRLILFLHRHLLHVIHITKKLCLPQIKVSSQGREGFLHVTLYTSLFLLIPVTFPLFLPRSCSRKSDFSSVVGAGRDFFRSDRSKSREVK